MKYEKEFEQYSQNDFVKMLIRVYDVKLSTAKRTWYKYNKKRAKTLPVTVTKGHMYLSEEKEDLPRFKMIEFEDMLRYKLRITRSMLRKYGFRNLQINWLKDAGYEIIEDKPY